MTWSGKGEPQRVTIADKPLACPICANDKFFDKTAVVHGGLASFMNIEWGDSHASLFICSACGYVHWFFPPD